MSFAMSKGNEFPVWCRRAKTFLSPSRKDAFVNPPPYETDDMSTNMSDSMRVHSSGTQYKYKHTQNLKKIKSQYGPSKKHASHQYKKVTFEKPKRKSLVSLYRRNNNRGSNDKCCVEKGKQNLCERAQFGALPGTLGLSAGDGKTLEYKENQNVENKIKNPHNKPAKTTKKDHEINIMKTADKTSVFKTNQDTLCANYCIVDNKNDEKVLKNLDKIKHDQYSKPVNETLNNYFIKFDYNPRRKTINQEIRKDMRQKICQDIRQDTRLSSGDAKLASNIVEKKKEKKKKKKTNVCSCEKPKDDENLKNEQIPYSLQSVCNLIERLQSCVDKTKQANPDYKGQNSFVTNKDGKCQSPCRKIIETIQADPNFKGQESFVTNKDGKFRCSCRNKKEKKQAKSKKNSKKYMKSKPEVKDDRLCGDGVCTNVVKDSDFTCKCVERKRPNICDEMTCKVPLKEAGIIKRKMRCICRKYSKKFKGMEWDDTENSLGFCKEDDKTFALCREAYIKKYPNFKCCCKPKECTDETCEIVKEPSATISFISKLPFVGNVLAETISKAEDCLRRKLACTISEAPNSSVNFAETNNSSQNVRLKGPCICEKINKKCVCNKYNKKQPTKQKNINTLRSPVTPESIKTGTPVMSPSILKRKSGIKACLERMRMKLCKKLQPDNKYKDKIPPIQQDQGTDSVRKCRQNTCPKYTNTLSPNTTSSNKGQIDQNNKRTMVSIGQNIQIPGFGSLVASDSALMVSPSSSSICKCHHVCQCNLMKEKEKENENKKKMKSKPKKKKGSKNKQKKKPKKKRKHKPKPKPKQKPKQKPKPEPKKKPKPIKIDKAKLKRQQMKIKMRSKAEYAAAKVKQREEAKVKKRLAKEYKKNQVKQERLRRQQIEQLLRLTRGKVKAKETNFAVEFCTEVCKMIFGSALAIIKAAFKLIFQPRKSFMFLKQSFLNPMSTKQSILNWQQGHTTMFKLKMEKAISGSEKMIIMEDTCKESPLYQAFASKGKNNAERRRIEVETKQRRKRIAKRDQEALFGCRHILLTTLRRRPCMWVYHLCPNFYPQCLSLVIFWQNFSNMVLFCLAMVVWTPCILLCELCRGLMCCSLCTA